jgi:hypothetical protein
MTLSGVDHSDHWEHYTSSFLKLQNVGDTNSCTLIVQVSWICGLRGREVLTSCTCSPCSFTVQETTGRVQGSDHMQHRCTAIRMTNTVDMGPLALGCSCYTYFDRIRTRPAETVTGTSVSFSSCSPFQAYALYQDVQL